MGSVGDAYDNAMCESFLATLECELLARRNFCKFELLRGTLCFHGVGPPASLKCLGTLQFSVGPHAVFSLRVINPGEAGRAAPKKD
jgi:hypothetical protein